MIAIQSWKRGLTWGLHLACAVAAVAEIGTLLCIFAARLRYPMDIEWLEGHSLEEAWRVFHPGQPLYGDPALGVQTQIYPPFYFIVVAALGRVFGLDYWTGRLVSAVAFSAGCTAIAFVIARHAKEGRTGVVLALAAVACVAVAFPLVCSWYDLARVDSLAMGLVLVAAAVVTCSPPTPRRSILVAALLAAAIYTKQTHILFAAWITVFTFARDRRSGLVMAASLAVICLLAFGVLEVKSHGWFAWWMTLAAAQDLRPESFAEGEMMLAGFAPYLPPLLLVLPFMIGRRWVTRTTMLWVGMLAVALPVGMVPLMKVGGATNNLLPIVFTAPAVAILAALDYLDGPAAAARHRGASLGALLALSCAYVVLHRLSVAPYAPTEDARIAGADVERFRLVSPGRRRHSQPPVPRATQRRAYPTASHHGLRGAGHGKQGRRCATGYRETRTALGCPHRSGTGRLDAHATRRPLHPRVQDPAERGDLGHAGVRA